jgi:hypothetical protein
MTTISEQEFERICWGIYEDRETIIKHNPIGTGEETLLWMLLSVLISYLNLSEIEIPCFPGVPDQETYRQAILHVLHGRTHPVFSPNLSLNEFLQKVGAEN